MSSNYRNYHAVPDRGGNCIIQKSFLWVKPEVVARGIIRTIEKNKDVVYVPWFWRVIMAVIKAIPEKVFKMTKL